MTARCYSSPGCRIGLMSTCQVLGDHRLAGPAWPIRCQGGWKAPTSTSLCQTYLAKTAPLVLSPKPASVSQHPGFPESGVCWGRGLGFNVKALRMEVVVIDCGSDFKAPGQAEVPPLSEGHSDKVAGVRRNGPRIAW